MKEKKSDRLSAVRELRFEGWGNDPRPAMDGVLAIHPDIASDLDSAVSHLTGDNVMSGFDAGRALRAHAELGGRILPIGNMTDNEALEASAAGLWLLAATGRFRAALHAILVAIPSTPSSSAPVAVYLKVVARGVMRIQSKPSSVDVFLRSFVAELGLAKSDEFIQRKIAELYLSSLKKPCYQLETAERFAKLDGVPRSLVVLQTKELQDALAEVLDAVEDGQVYLIRSYTRARALLVPFSETEHSNVDAVLRGEFARNYSEYLGEVDSGGVVRIQHGYRSGRGAVLCPPPDGCRTAPTADEKRDADRVRQRRARARARAAQRQVEADERNRLAEVEGMTIDEIREARAMWTSSKKR